MKDTIFYTGKFSFDGKNVVHPVTNSSDPVFYGKDLTREVQFKSDGSILLVGKGKSGGLVRLVWKKAQ